MAYPQGYRNHYTPHTSGGYSVGMEESTETAAMPHSGPHGYISNKDDYLKRLRRIEGQARGLQGMVSDEKYCIDILTQISAMTSALQSVALGLLDDHLNHCVVDAARPAARKRT
ncbi:DNA-binding transcriptional regulator, FrmR family [Cryobacterium psychrotolerans]|uniref:DNA-binding transcriptional regulator, FrmR family n=1 Tax=Cryobacterium psychrotolerans TaxID=386301 RepID=A0A1G9G9D3_9MICO|nr:DNA-binding transcriptional regulator, FrmR family [Cryobacterium psychrotolerans]